jgi:mRNA-degrading endonuclease RelE of RelBE toxin-antitoxin system
MGSHNSHLLLHEIHNGTLLDISAALPHNPFVSIPMLTVVETSAFARRAEKLLSVEEHEELLFYLALHPESGDEIPGTGGVRKVRFAAKGKGKSGGVRVIYYFFDEENPLYAIFSLRQKRASKSHTGSKKTGRSLCSDAQSGRKGTEAKLRQLPRANPNRQPCIYSRSRWTWMCAPSAPVPGSAGPNSRAVLRLTRVPCRTGNKAAAARTALREPI